MSFLALALGLIAVPLVIAALVFWRRELFLYALPFLAILNGLPDGTTVNLVGHADITGNAAADQTLSEQRDANVEAAPKAALGGKDIVFTTSAKGDTEPVADLAKSRRVTIEFTR